MSAYTIITNNDGVISADTVYFDKNDALAKFAKIINDLFVNLKNDGTLFKINSYDITALVSVTLEDSTEYTYILEELNIVPSTAK